jgi:hypothetical protein
LAPPWEPLTGLLRLTGLPRLTGLLRPTSPGPIQESLKARST